MRLTDEGLGVAARNAGLMLFLLGPVAAAHADAAAAPAPNEAMALPTVVVSARRIDENAQQVPVSMVVLDGEDLDRAGFTASKDLPERVAGLSLLAPSARLSSFSIRGLGSSSYNAGVESSAGLFVDGVYLGRQGFSTFDLVDIDRIEVLRGPQGTLFGKNTTAGAILIHTQLPSSVFGAQLESSIGDYGSRQLRGSVTGPLADGALAGRMTGYLSRRDGLIDNLYNGERLNDTSKQGLRGQLLWSPAADLAGRFIAEFGRVNQHCCILSLVAPERAKVLARDQYMEYQRSSLDPRDRVADSSGPTQEDVQQIGASAEFTWDVSPTQQWVSLSAWRDWRLLTQAGDSTSLHLANDSRRDAQTQFTQEFRFNTRSERVNTTAGLFYLYQDLEGGDVAVLGPGLAPWVFGGLVRQSVPTATRSNSGVLVDTLVPPQTFDGMTIPTPYAQRTDNLAGFGASEWALTPALSLTAGLRYTYEWKSGSVDQSRYGGNPNASPLAATNVLTPLGNLIGQDLSGMTWDGLINSVAGGPYHRSERYAEGRLSGQGALTWRPVDAVTVYGAVARGYKSGGINLAVTSPSVQPTFKPETANNYEVGLKTRLLSQRLMLALALYRTDVSHYQALTFDATQSLIPNPRPTNLINVRAVKMQGVELEGRSLLARGLEARLGVAYNRATTTDFTDAPNAATGNNDKNLSGQQLYNAPVKSGNLGVEYSKPLGAALVLAGAVEISARSGTYATVEHGDGSYINGYALTNLSAGLADNSKKWGVTAWVRNVFDVNYVAAIQTVYGIGDYGGFAGDPRTFGMTVSARFE